MRGLSIDGEGVAQALVQLEYGERPCLALRTWRCWTNFDLGARSRSWRRLICRIDFVLWLVIGLAAGVLAVFAVFRAVPRDPWHSGRAHWWRVFSVAWLAAGVTDLLGLEATNLVGAIVIAALGAVGVLPLLRRLQPATA